MLESHRQHKAKAQWNNLRRHLQEAKANLRQQAVETQCQGAKDQCQEAKPLDQAKVKPHQSKAEPRPELHKGEPDPNTTGQRQRQEVTKQGDGRKPLECSETK